MTKNDDKTPADTASPENLEKGDYGTSDSGKALTAPAAPAAPKAKFKGSDLKVVGRKIVGAGITQPPAPKGFTKTINESYSPEANMVKEEMTIAKNGQWNLETVKKDEK